MKKENKHYLKLTLTLFAAAALAISFYFILANLSSVKTAFGSLIDMLMPFIIGGVIAYILTPICNFFESKLSNKIKGARGISILLALVLAIVVMVALLLLIVPSLIESIQSILNQLPSNMTEFQEWALNLAGDNETLVNYINDFTEAASTDLPAWVETNIMPYLEALMGSLSTGIISFVGVMYDLLIGIVVSIYLMAGRKTFARQGDKLIHSIFTKKWADAIVDEFRYANKMFSGFISGRLVDSLIIGIICFIAMMILQIPNTVLVSVIVGITNILPFFGPWIGGIPSFLLILMTDPGKAILFLVLIVVLQQFDGNILGPRILGDRTGLSSFWVLFSILIFGDLFGFIGMIIGVPVFAVIYDIICKLVNKGIAYRKRQELEAAKIE